MNGKTIIVAKFTFTPVSSFNLSKVFEFVCQMFARGVDGSPLIVSDGAGNYSADTAIRAPL
jgi:hypothetical protein